jgi:hypothetical protein
MNTREIIGWLTDDSRRVPVLVKGTISIGPLASTLTKMELGKDVQ